MSPLPAADRDTRELEDSVREHLVALYVLRDELGRAEA